MLAKDPPQAPQCPIAVPASPRLAWHPTPGGGDLEGPSSAWPCAVCPAPGICLRLQEGPRSPSVGWPLAGRGCRSRPLQHPVRSGAPWTRRHSEVTCTPVLSPFPLLPRVTSETEPTPCSQRFCPGPWRAARPENHCPLPGEGASSGSTWPF